MADEHPFVRLARTTIEHYVRTGQVIGLPEKLPGELGRRAGTFVSLHRGGELRGCIGTIEPVRDSLAEEIIANAISAATRDPRFPPVSTEELADLEISVDVLDESEPIQSVGELDPKRYGIIVQAGDRRGLLLPDLEGVDTAEQQLLIALRKAWISPQEKYHLFRFQVTRYS
ncbi:MAG TPA: AmmeMemoRadiSam system protein A [Chloroflexi bacterium]|jgi:AmmeMemoRadiSam system protein A|nr:AmmeMemoRadiSam system protein A [Chloroflexota bacterium]